MPHGRRAIGQLGRLLSGHWPAVVLVACAAALVFTNLGQDYLWEDEGDTAVLARGILQTGLPVAWDGTAFSDADFGQRLTENLVMVSHPWLPYYLTAASFAAFGESTFAARLPFALAGVGTVLVVYAMAFFIFRTRRAAVSAAVLMVVSVQFLLFARQARNYTLNALLTCLLVWQFERLRSWKSAAIFVVLGVLLFHTHPIGLAVIGALGVVTLILPSYRETRRWFWRSAPLVWLYAVPWLRASRSGYEQNANIASAAWQFGARLLQYLVEVASVTPLIGIIVLAIFVVMRARRSAPETPVGRPRAARRRVPAANSAVARAFTPRELRLSAVLGAVGLAYMVVMALTQTRDFLWVSGVRYTSAVIPFAAILAGGLIAKTSGQRRKAWVALMLVFCVTRTGRITPWVAWAEPAPLRDPDAIVGFHVPQRGFDRFFRTGTIRYVRSLVRPSPGVIAAVSEFLNAHASSGDIVVTNYAWEALYFHTGLPQGLKILPSFPIYRAARDRGLPEYVFSAQGVRWIVWRRVWAPMWGQDCEKLLLALREAGIPVQQVASVPETLYENRENIHSRRFADGYLYPWFEQLPDTLIYRVDWPAASPAETSASAFR